MVDKLYREMDKVAAALTRRLDEKQDMRKSIRLLEAQVKKLHDAYFGNELEPLCLTRREIGSGLCPSCERCKPEFLDWEKFPARVPGPAKPHGRNDSFGMKAQQKKFQTVDSAGEQRGALTERVAPESSFRVEPAALPDIKR